MKGIIATEVFLVCFYFLGSVCFVLVLYYYLCCGKCFSSEKYGSHIRKMDWSEKIYKDVV